MVHESSSEQWCGLVSDRGRRLASSRFRIAVLSTLLVLGTIRTVRAQSPEAPDDAAVRIGPLALAPVVSIYDAGRDSNIYNRSVDFNPQGDITATTRLSVDEWLRMSRARMYGRTQLDYHYFKELTALRVLDTAATARVDFLLNRVTPFVEWGLTNASFQQNLEIDAIARRLDTALLAGAELRLSARFRASAYLRRRDLEYDEESFFLGSDLGQALNHTSSSEGVQVKYVATPYTSFAVAVEQVRDRFGSDISRNSDGYVVLPSVEFNPRAVISGRAEIGFRSLAFHSPGVPDFTGPVARVDLSYVLLGSTRFTLAARRDLEYSYVARNYVVLDGTLFVTHRLRESWEIGGSVNRGRISYSRETLPSGIAPLLPDETVSEVTAGVGYITGHMRIGMEFDRRWRTNDLPLGYPYRSYRRMRIGPTFTYIF
jgi:hypothetical protein